MNISGLTIIEDFITPEQERTLIDNIDKMPWSNVLKRRTQHYGYTYEYMTKTLSEAEPIPDFVEFLYGRFGMKPEQLIINEYEPGQGIAKHIDANVFGNRIISLSLGSDCVMNFTRGSLLSEILLKKRTLLIMENDARKAWSHEIKPRTYDVVDGVEKKRERRISLTFRTVK